MRYALETGRIAAEVVHRALAANDPTALQQYPRRLHDEYGQYFKVARLFARVAGRPKVMQGVTRLGMRNRTLMDWTLRIMSNEMDEGHLGPAELAYRTAARIAVLAPNA
jgi:flavin-dependent dehydrogenase